MDRVFLPIAARSWPPTFDWERRTRLRSLGLSELGNERQSGGVHISVVRIAFALIVLALIAAPGAAAKDFRPGDVRVCGPARCVGITDARAVVALGLFYYSGTAPARVRAPALGVPYYELRFRNGYATGIVATRKLDRFLSYGVNLGRFSRGAWYSLPRVLSAGVRPLTRGIQPYRLTAEAVTRSR
jgi:hypothetical protein